MFKLSCPGLTFENSSKEIAISSATIAKKLVNSSQPNHTVDTEFSVTNFFCLHFSEHAQWGLPVMSDILVKIFVDISCNICGLFLL